MSREENSVLFSLRHLQQLALASGPALGRPRPSFTRAPDLPYTPIALNPQTLLRPSQARLPRWLAPSLVGLGLLAIAVLVLAVAIVFRQAPEVRPLPMLALPSPDLLRGAPLPAPTALAQPASTPAQAPSMPARPSPVAAPAPPTALPALTIQTLTPTQSAKASLLDQALTPSARPRRKRPRLKAKQRRKRLAHAARRVRPRKIAKSRAKARPQRDVDVDALLTAAAAP